MSTVFGKSVKVSKIRQVLYRPVKTVESSRLMWLRGSTRSCLKLTSL